MTPDDFRAHLTRLGYGATAFARLVGYDSRQVRRWLSGSHEIPLPVQMLLRGEGIPNAKKPGHPIKE